MKSGKKGEKKLSLNQTVNFEQKSIQLYKKFSSPNLLSYPKKDKYILRLNKIRRKKLDSAKMLNIDTLEQKLMNSYKDSLMNRKTVDEENTHFIRKIKINGNFKNNYELKQSFGNNKKNNQRTTPDSKNGKESKFEHKLLYEDIIKLKDKMNKLKIELCFIKSLNRKKDEEIRELLKYKEDAKFYSGKKENEIFYQKLKIFREIINLKNLYENIKIDFIRQKDINDSITNQIKILNITEMKNKNEKNKKKLKKKLEKYNKIRRKNDELEIELTDSDWVKNKFMENHKYLTELEIDIDKKFSKIKLLQINLAKLKEKYEILKNKKSQMIRRNSSIKSDNKKLLKDKKSRQEYIIKQTEIEKKITLYKTKTRDLINETNEKENLINDLKDKKIFNFNLSQSYNFRPILQKNPDEIKEKQVTLYESLIQDSKNKQNELIVKIKDLFKKTKINKNNNNKIKKDIIIKNKLDNNNINNINKNINDENNEINLENNIKFNNINFLNNNNSNINKKYGNDFNNNNNYNFKYGQLTIENILSKYRNNNNNNIQNNLFNTLNKFNLNEKNNNLINELNNPFMLTFQQNQSNINLNPFTNQENLMNNIDKLIQNKKTNNNNIIQKIKAKYLFNNDSLNNKISSKDKEVSELENKLNFYKKKLFSQSALEDKYINFKIDIKNNNQENSYINSKNNTINLNASEINNNSNNNDKSFSFKNNLKNNNSQNININNLKESKISQSQFSHNIGEETINFSLSEDESGLSGYFKFKGSQLEEKDKDKEYNYNDVLPIINKVSKLKEIKEEDDNNIASNIVNNIMENIPNNISNNEESDNEEEKYKNIMNKFKEEDKENTILYNQINNQSLNTSKNSKNEKPKLIRKNSSDKDKKRNINKIISFEEFLSKENSNE